jgi:hypothetical protein
VASSISGGGADLDWFGTVYTSPALPRGSHTFDIDPTLNKRVNIDDFVVTR